MSDVWEKVGGRELHQGELLRSCLVPVIPENFRDTGEEIPLPTDRYDLIIVTQSCDLANNKSPFVALSPIYSLEIFSKSSPTFNDDGVRENARNGRVEGVHLLASPDSPGDNQQVLVVNFREIYSLPVDYLRSHAETNCSPRWRLRPPYLEHFSQAFARFFMRVGLPSEPIASYKKKKK